MTPFVGPHRRILSVVLTLAVLAVALAPPAWSQERDEAVAEAIVFVSRDLSRKINLDGPSVTAPAARGRLLVREPSGEVRTLVDARVPDAPRWTPIDVLGPDVSWDGRRIVFAGFSPAEWAWRVFEVGSDGGGLRQVTTADRSVDLERYGEAARHFERYDDVDPCYLPDGRICFVSTRYPGSAPSVRGQARTSTW